jgi:tetratricopeptide (TPR) repeat protein
VCPKHLPVSAEALKHGRADPKDKAWEFDAIMQSEDAFQQKREGEGEALLLQVQEKDPIVALVPFLLGELALRKRNWDRAARQLQRCLDVNPDFDNAMTALAPMGRTDGAKKWLKKALEINPQNHSAWYLMGLFELRTAQFRRRITRKQSQIKPNFPSTQRGLGIALPRRKKYASASTHLLIWKKPSRSVRRTPSSTTILASAMRKPAQCQKPPRNTGERSNSTPTWRRRI